MIIKKLTLYNFGVYAGINTFEFTCKHPIVLIGGMNGRGKTTFLEAILLALYGSNSIAYKESRYKSYSQYLRAYTTKESSSQESYVEIEFETTEAEKDIYLVKREWNTLTKRTNEKVYVFQNGVYSEFLTNNWTMFVENILPSALSSFYFFDGEKIAELAVDNNDYQMKESIRSMLGITVLDVLKNDLKRNLQSINKNLNNKEKLEEVERLRSEKDMAINNLEEIDQKLLNDEEEIYALNEKIEQLHKRYEIKGGAAMEQRQELIRNRSENKMELDQIEESLVECSASVLPLNLTKNLIHSIKLQAEDEHNDSVIQQAISQLYYFLEKYEPQNKDDIKINNDFIKFVENNVINNSSAKIYGMSDQALFQLNSLIEKMLDDTIKKADCLLKRKKEVKHILDNLDSYLSIDINENEISHIYEQIKTAEDDLIKKKIELNSLYQERSKYNSDVIHKTVEFNRYVETYLEKIELFDDADRKNKYSNMALQIIDRFMIELQKQKTDVLGKTITVCYKKLANKKKLIETIAMDSETLEIAYYDINGNIVDKDSLSAGEKQLMVIAILWALAICSKKKLPVIIDTPLSRLDSLHRIALIKTYFPNASEQTIILSTDSEIDKIYYEMMKDDIGDEFTLVYDEKTKSTSIKKGYFVNDY